MLAGALFTYIVAQGYKNMSTTIREKKTGKHLTKTCVPTDEDEVRMLSFHSVVEGNSLDTDCFY